VTFFIIFDDTGGTAGIANNAGNSDSRESPKTPIWIKGELHTMFSRARSSRCLRYSSRPLELTNLRLDRCFRVLRNRVILAGDNPRSEVSRDGICIEKCGANSFVMLIGNQQVQLTSPPD